MNVLPLMLSVAMLSGCSIGLVDYTLDSGDLAGGADGGGASDGGGSSGDGGGPDTGLNDGGSGDGGSGDAGSGDGGSGDAGSSDGGSSGLDALAVDDVTPSYGSNSGGTTVTVAGGPFNGGNARVWFGGVEATVLSESAGTLQVTTPSIGTTGLADVKVETDTHTGTLTNAFEFWPDAAGKAGAIGAMYWLEQVGGYWGGGTNYQGGSISVFFLDPTDMHWWELYAPAKDSCRSDSYTWGGTVSVLDPGVNTLTLAPTSGPSKNATWVAADGMYSASFTGAADAFTSDSSWTLQAMGGGYPNVNVPAFGQTAGRPNLTSPSIGGGSYPRVSRYQTFTWSGVTADWILITMSVWNSNGSGYESAVSCVVNNDGNFSFDGSQFSSWPTNRQVDVEFGAVREATGDMEWDNSESRMVGIYAIYGAGLSQ